MNKTLLAGLIIATVIIIVLFAVYYRIYNSKNKKYKRILSVFLSFIGIISGLATIINLIISGIKSSINEDSLNYSIVAEQNDGPLISENNGYIIINNYNASSNPQRFGTVDYDEVESFPVGWADSIGGRDSYTIDEINNGALKDKIVFNSISDSAIGHEFNFVGAKKNDGETLIYI